MALSVSEARQIVLQQAHALPAVPCDLMAAVNRVLAEDVSCPNDSPPFDKALMDGFALKRDAFESGSAPDEHVFRIVDTVFAGRVPSRVPGPTEVVRIMTGAPLPSGCNCVVPLERVRVDDQNEDLVMISSQELKSEANLMRQGAAAKKGQKLLATGTRLQPQQVAALAEFGYGHVAVRRIPEVAVLATGDELIAWDEPLSPGRIRNSNEPMLVGQILSANAKPVPLGIARDIEDDLARHIAEGLKADILVLTGGVSAGALDLVPKMLQRAGVQQVFHGVNMKPGKPLWFGTFSNVDHQCLVFGLPGNPVSSLVCFELFVRPLIEAMTGSPGRPQLQAMLSEPFVVKGNRPVFQPASIQLTSTGLVAKPVPWSSSADLRATVEGNGMILLNPSETGMTTGTVVDAWFWGSPQL